MRKASLLLITILCVLSSEKTYAQWISCHGPIGGSVTAIDTCGGFLWAATRDGGIYRSNNNAQSWEPFSNGLPPVGVQTLVSSQGKLFAGTAGSGIYVLSSPNGSWTHVPTGVIDGNLTILRKDGGWLYACAYGIVLRSNDNGQTWNPAINGLATIYTFANTELAAAGGLLLTYVMQGVQGFYRSADNGSNWTPVTAPASVSGAICSMLKGIGNRIYAFFDGTNTPLFYTDDAGLSWNTIGTASGPAYMTDLTISNGSYVAATTGSVYVYPLSGGSAGQGWSPIYGGLFAPLPIVNTVFKDAGGIYLGTEGQGVVKADTSLSSLQFANNGFLAARVNFIDGNGDKVIAYVDRQPNLWSTVNSGQSWQKDSIINYYFSAVRSSTIKGGLWYLGIQNMGVELSDDNGQSWRFINTGLPTYPQTHCLMTTTNGNVLLGSDNKLYKAVNDTTWTAIYTFQGNEEVHYLIEAGNYLFAGTQMFPQVTGQAAHLYRSADGGQSWQIVSGGWGVQYEDVAGLTLQGDRIIAGTTGEGTRYSMDYGNRWSPLDSGFSTATAGYVLFTDLKTIGGKAYACLIYEDEMYELDPDSLVWHSVTDLPGDPRALTVWGNDTVLYVGTVNNGVWKKSITPAGVRGITPGRSFAADLYPNPSQRPMLDLTGADLPVRMKIVSSDGRVFFTKLIDQKRFQIDQPQLGQGIYYLVLTDKAQRKTTKVWEKKE